MFDPSYVEDPKETVRVPGITAEQLQQLDELFPEQSAPLAWTVDEIRFRAGQRDVVRFLHEQHRREADTIRNRRNVQQEDI